MLSLFVFMTKSAERVGLELLADDTDIADADTEVIEPMTAQSVFEAFIKGDYDFLRKLDLIPSAIQRDVTAHLNDYLRTESNEKRKREIALAVRHYMDSSYNPPSKN